MRTIIILLLLAVNCFAFDDKYSFKDWSEADFTTATDLNGKTIRGAYFYKEGKPFREVFPADMKGVTFEFCNLDNVVVPEGNTMIGCCNRQIMFNEALKDNVTVDRTLTISKDGKTTTEAYTYKTRLSELTAEMGKLEPKSVSTTVDLSKKEIVR